MDEEIFGPIMPIIFLEVRQNELKIHYKNYYKATQKAIAFSFLKKAQNINKTLTFPWYNM